MLSDEWLPRYRLLENFTIKWNGNGNGNAHGNGNAYDRGDYNSSFALRAVELKSDNKQCLLDTPRRRHSIIKDSYQNAKVREKICIYKSHGIINSYKGK